MIAAGVALVLLGSQAHAATADAPKAGSLVSVAVAPKVASHVVTAAKPKVAATAAVVSAASQAKAPVPAQDEKKVVSADLFSDGTWHAVSPSWPGTFKFDDKTHKVVLSPLGASVIEAKYSYTVQPAALGAHVVEGTLRMTNAAGQVSVSQFRLEDGKNLALTFQGEGDVRPESYVRMTPAEESAEVARIRTLIAQGKLKLPVPVENKEVQLP